MSKSNTFKSDLDCTLKAKIDSVLKDIKKFNKEESNATQKTTTR